MPLPLLVLLLVLGRAAVVSAETNAPAAAPAPAPVTAQPAPAFALRDLDGREVKLDGYADLPVIVLFWASWDKPSLKQLPVLVELQKRHGGAGLRILAIALDADLGALRQSVADNRLTFPVLRFDLPVVEGFGGIEAIPTLFILDRNHNIIRRHVGWVEANVLAPDLEAVLKK